MKIAVWFSCGAASAAAAYYTLCDYGGADIHILNNPIHEEDEDNQRFLRDVSDWLGIEIAHVRSSKYPEQRCESVWRDRRFMSGVHGAPCTVELKKMARQAWEVEHKPDFHVLGFTYEEKKRHERFILTERSNVLPVLINRKITKQMCYELLAEHKIELPRVYRAGYPNANCIGCVKATSPTYWNHVREQHPTVFAQRAELSRELGARLVRVDGKRIFLDELSSSATGRPMKNMSFECGIFCEEK